MGPTGPPDDLGSEPQSHLARRQIDHRPRKVRVAAKIGRHAIRVGEAEDPSDLCRTNQILRVDLW